LTKLNKLQITRLEKVARIKAELHDDLEKARLEYEDKKEGIETPLREAVQRAYEAKVPIRQIGMQGLGTKDYATVNRFLAVERKSVLDLGDQFVPTPIKPAVIPTQEGFVVRDRLKNEWEFWLLDFDGAKVVELQTGKKPIPEDVMEAVAKAYPEAGLDWLKEANGSA
jgi:hypothetical protein